MKRCTGFALAILQLEERPRVRVLARPDIFDRFVSVLVYLPRERAGGRVVEGSDDSSPASTRARSAASRLSSLKGRWCASISSSRVRRSESPSPTARRSNTASAPSCAPGTTLCRKRLALAHDPTQVQAAVRTLQPRLLGRLPRSLFAGGGGGGHPHYRRPVVAEAAGGRILRSAPEAGPRPPA